VRHLEGAAGVLALEGSADGGHEGRIACALQEIFADGVGLETELTETLAVGQGDDALLVDADEREGRRVEDAGEEAHRRALLVHEVHAAAEVVELLLALAIGGGVLEHRDADLRALVRSRRSLLVHGKGLPSLEQYRAASSEGLRRGERTCVEVPFPT